MTSHEIKSNEDLHRYILWLAHELKAKKQDALADRLFLAGAFACGSPSEFLHEAGCALKAVAVPGCTILNDSERKQVTTVIQMIDNAFRKIGGA
jgi:hypothetical protein